MLGLPQLTEKQFEEFETLVSSRLGFRMNIPQRDIMRDVAGLNLVEKQNMMIQASPGAGKTTLIVILSILITYMLEQNILAKQPKILALAHMRQNRAMLQMYLPDWVHKSTVHAVGRAKLYEHGNYMMSKWKLPNITEAALKAEYPMGVFLFDESNKITNRPIKEIYWAVSQFISVLNAWLITPDNIEGIEWLYASHTPRIAGITPEFRQTLITQIAPKVLRACDENRANANYINFDEMLTVPIQERMFDNDYDIVILDEAQDLTLAQQVIAHNAAKYCFAVGDSQQAIMQFSGADIASWERLSYIIDAHIRTMPITQRCSIEVVRTLQGLFDIVVPRQDAPQGSVTTLPDKDAFIKHADRPATGIICRTHASVAEAYIALMKADIKTPIIVLGSDVYGVVKRVVGQLKRIRLVRAFSKVTFKDYLHEWHQSALKKARAIEQVAQRDLAIDEVMQERDLVINLWNFFDPSTPDELIDLVGERFGTAPDEIIQKQKLFKDSVVVGTAHRWKGLETAHVVIYQSDDFVKKAKSDKARDVINQEREVLFVAASRPTESLAWYPERKITPVREINRDVQYVARTNTRLPYPNFDTSLFNRDIVFSEYDGLSDAWKEALS